MASLGIDSRDDAVWSDTVSDAPSARTVARLHLPASDQRQEPHRFGRLLVEPDTSEGIDDGPGIVDQSSDEVPV